MKTFLKQALKQILPIITITFLLTTLITPKAWADNDFAFAISPLHQKLVLNPGDSFSSTLSIINKSDDEKTIKYTVKATYYYVNEDYENVFGEQTNRSKMANWITINSPTEGILKKDEKTNIDYTINVPNDAPGGGQYATILVTAKAWNGEEENDTSSNDGLNTGIKETKSISYLLFAEITGDIIRQGEIIDTNVPSFLLSGDIKGSATIKNTGNVHGDAIYKLQVFPLFSDEEIYTNEEYPKTATILPDRTRYEELAWEKTPGFGIFNVLYTVEFEGVTTQVSKMVIICPLYLLFVIFVAIIAIIIWLVMRMKSKKN